MNEQRDDEITITHEDIPPSARVDIAKVQQHIWQLFHKKPAFTIPTSQCSFCSNLREPGSIKWLSLQELALSARSCCLNCHVMNKAVMEFCVPLYQGYSRFIPFDSSCRVRVSRSPNGSQLSLFLFVGNLEKALSMQIEFFSTNSGGFFPAGQEITPEVDLESCLSFLHHHLQQCHSSHDLCQPKPPRDASPRIQPARFLFIDTHAKPPVVRLVDGGEVTGPYTALSHCWGNKTGIVETTTQTLERHYTQGIALTSLPKSFLDATNISLGLGIYYIWIDSICIIQDDRIDWEQESVKMAAVYLGAYLTIAVSTSPNPSGGCFLPRSWSPGSSVGILHSDVKARWAKLGFPPEIQVRYLGRCHKDLNIGNHNNLQTKVLVAPLLTRAWAFQERILSKRIIHFHREEMVFECNHFRVCECGQMLSLKIRGDFNNGQSPKAILGMASVGELHETKLWGTWEWIVKGYSQLYLTVERDRLPGLAGLARHLSELMNQTYMAGLWKDALPRQLMWFVLYTDTVTRRAQDAPTWSWASIVSESNSRGQHLATFLFTVQDAALRPGEEHRWFITHPAFEVLPLFDEESWRKPSSYALPPKDCGLRLKGLLLPCKIISGYHPEQGPCYKIVFTQLRKDWKYSSLVLPDISDGPGSISAFADDEKVELFCLLVASVAVYHSKDGVANAVPDGDCNGGNRMENVLILQLVDTSQGIQVCERVGIARWHHYEAGAHWREYSDFEGIKPVEIILQ
ncbi:heterokaryon incompatibility protein-domain-containing protein [Podospora fimiseda]|uniref:Heterokaryon incompatibility protein-domain-containing protein n=1 Tax=Podospora fimiseda TaxID=252190 RepID=A0AAN7GPR4_9PEZI|nr:heterokaryon incompatibility protein-domain-containing protein [Podospora fimiseda]